MAAATGKRLQAAKDLGMSPEQMRPQEEEYAVQLCMIIIARPSGVRCDRQRSFVQRAQQKLEKAQDAAAAARAALEEADAKVQQRSAAVERAKTLLEQLEAMRPPPAAAPEAADGD
eukprot:6947861-Pyramimonas_sp.AAC.1